MSILGRRPPSGEYVNIEYVNIGHCKGLIGNLIIEHFQLQFKAIFSYQKDRSTGFIHWE